MSENSKKRTGDFGEKQAYQYLQRCGYEILAVNWRHKHLEVDLIVKDGEVLVFVEVKTRSSKLFGRPADFVNKKKEDNLMRLAEVYVDQFKYQGEIRFDIVSVYQGKTTEIEHIKDAFWHY